MNMSHPSKISLLALLEKAIKSPNNEKLLQEVKNKGKEILQSLQDSKTFELHDDILEGTDPVWVAQIYEALTSNIEESLIEKEINQVIFEAIKEDESSIGIAYKDALMVGIPENLKKFEGYFSQLKKISEEEFRYLLETHSVESAAPHSRRIAEYGITPLTVFFASEAISGLLNRLMENYELDRNITFILSNKSVQISNGLNLSIDPLELVISEINNMAECEIKIAESIYYWLISIAHFKPYIFSGFYAKPNGESISLELTNKTYNNLFQRWGLI